MWDYLFDVMRLMNFPPCWIHWIHTCLTSASFQVLFNGEPGPPFSASNGVRQNDPLAPYLFLIGMEGLSMLLHKVVNEFVIDSPSNKKHITVSHILYADDALLFVRANPKNAKAVNYILK